LQKVTPPLWRKKKRLRPEVRVDWGKESTEEDSKVNKWNFFLKPFLAFRLCLFCYDCISIQLLNVSPHNYSFCASFPEEGNLFVLGYIEENDPGSKCAVQVLFFPFLSFLAGYSLSQLSLISSNSFCSLAPELSPLNGNAKTILLPIFSCHTLS